MFINIQNFAYTTNQVLYPYDELTEYRLGTIFERKFNKTSETTEIPIRINDFFKE